MRLRWEILFQLLQFSLNQTGGKGIVSVTDGITLSFERKYIREKFFDKRIKRALGIFQDIEEQEAGDGISPLLYILIGGFKRVRSILFRNGNGPNAGRIINPGFIAAGRDFARIFTSSI